jgi:hypothetical protein
MKSSCVGLSLVLAAFVFGCSSNSTAETSDAGGKTSDATSKTDTGVPATSFHDFYTGVIQAYKCLDCHVPDGAGVFSTDDAGQMIVGGMLDLSTEEKAYAALVNVKAQGIACKSSGLMRVVPNDPDASLIVLKTELAYTEQQVKDGHLKEAVQAPCGAEMPKGCTQPAKDGGLACLFTGDIRTLTDWINSGAPAP